MVCIPMTSPCLACSSRVENENAPASTVSDEIRSITVTRPTATLEIYIYIYHLEDDVPFVLKASF